MRVTSEPLPRRFLVGLPFTDIMISGHGATACCMMLILLLSLIVLHDISLCNKSRSCVV